MEAEDPYEHFMSPEGNIKEDMMGLFDKFKILSMLKY
jgi:hypothetical protein